jgi:hypothetical protein
LISPISASISVNMRRGEEVEHLTMREIGILLS